MTAGAPRRPVVVTGMSVLSAYGRGTEPLEHGVLAGEPAFVDVTRFDVSRARTRRAAHLPGSPVLTDELVRAVDDACTAAGLDDAERAAAPLLLARHADGATARLPLAEQAGEGTGSTAPVVAAACGLAGAERTYTPACVAASFAVADAASAISAGRRDRVVVTAGYLVDPDNFALFDAGRALAADGHIRPFSARRKGLLLGDAVGAVVLEAADAARARGAEPLARIAGWGRAGDGYHVCQPHPEGTGMARAIGAALGRAGIAPADVGYVNAHGTGTPYNDSSEAAAMHRAFGPLGDAVPISSTKSLHGHTLEAAGLLELVVSVLALRAGRLPVNAGFLEPDEACRLDLVLAPGRELATPHVLSLNAAFGGANTALVVSVA